MEGWVNKKTRSDIFGQVYKRRYIVLDSNNLITYEGYDLSTKTPIGQKAGAVTLNGIEWSIERLRHKDHPYGLILSHSHLDSIFLSFEKGEQMALWMMAIKDALLKRDHTAFELGNLDCHYKILDLESFIQDDELPFSVDILNHAYRHTERKFREEEKDSVDVTKMDLNINIHRAKRAYYALFEKHFGGNVSKRKTSLKFTVTVRKFATEGGASMGFTLVESPSSTRVMVQSVDRENIMVSAISESIEPYDELSTIDGEVVSAWPVGRIAQRLSSFHLPAGQSVDIEFTRRVRESGGADNESLVAAHLFGHSLVEEPEQYSLGITNRTYAQGSSEDTKKTTGEAKQETTAAATEGVIQGHKRGSLRRASLAVGALLGITPKDKEENNHTGDKEEENENNEENDNEEHYAAGGGSANAPDGSVDGEHETDSFHDDDMAMDPKTPTAHTPVSPRKSFSIFGKSAAHEDAEAEVVALREKLERAEERAKELEATLRSKEDKICFYENQEMELCDQIADLTSELKAIKSGKQKLHVEPVSGLTIEEKVQRLKERYELQ